MSFEFDDSADGDDDKLFVLDGDLCVTRCMVKAPHVIWLPSGSTVAAVRHHTYKIKNHVWTFLSVFS